MVWIKGITAPVENDNFGNSLRALVDRIDEQLLHKYGLGKKTDILLPGSIWDEPQYWMNALDANERIYSYAWERETHRRLPDDIETVFVGAVSIDSSSAVAVIEYASPRLKEAEAELERGMSDLL